MNKSIWTIMVILILSCSICCNHTAEMNSTEDYHIAEESDIYSPEIKEDTMLLNNETYVKLPAASSEAPFVEFYNWEVDLSCFEVYETTANGTVLYDSPYELNKDVLVLVQMQQGVQQVDVYVKEDAYIDDLNQYSADFFGKAYVDHIITDSKTLRPIIENHFHGKNAIHLDQEARLDLEVSHGFSKITLETNRIPGLWYTFYTIGDNTAYVYSREANGFVEIGFPMMYKYGIVTQQFPADTASMIKEAMINTSVDSNSGYWFNDTLVRKGALQYEESLLIPLKAYLNALPCKLTWNDNTVTLSSGNGRKGDDCEYSIDLKRKTIQSSWPWVLNISEENSDRFVLEEMSGEWYLDFDSFQRLLNAMQIQNTIIIDTDQNMIKLCLS